MSARTDPAACHGEEYGQREGDKREGQQRAAHGFTSFKAKVQLVVGLQPLSRSADSPTRSMPSRA